MMLSDLTSPVWAQGIQGFAYQTLGCTSCQDWRVSGVCFWLKCSITGCRIKSSIRVSHNIPDVMIASFNGVSPLGLPYGMPTDGAVSAHGQGTINYKNVEVIGNPAVSVYEQLWHSTGLFCASEAKPLVPYYNATLSERLTGLSWNENYVEQVYALAHIFRNRVDGLGHLYPRCGWRVQSDDVKSAALTTVRAAHVVTRSGQPHLYTHLNGSCGNRCWGPGEYEPGDNASGQFQMLLPKSESKVEPLVGMNKEWTEGIFNDEKNTPGRFGGPTHAASRKAASSTQLSFKSCVSWQYFHCLCFG